MFGDRAGEAEIIDRLWRRFLVTGGFPGQLFDQHRSFDECRRDLRNDIVGLALQRDLPVENADPRVRALFVYLVQNSGAELDARVRAQELDADKRSVQAWIEWLEAAALVERVPRFTAKPAVRLRAAQKCFASDHGLVAAFAPEADPLGDEGVRGRITETLALGILRDVIGDRAAHLAFGVVEKPAGEIDFVFEWGGARIGVEVTAAPPKSEKVAAVHVARSALKLDRALLIHGGDAARIGEAVSSVPLRDFASDPERFLVGAAR